jgi:serine/threonine protein kinase
MAPEILDTSRTSPTDETVDWWAVGIIAFEFITGNLPFNAKTKEEVFSNIRSMKI